MDCESTKRFLKENHPLPSFRRKADSPQSLRTSDGACVCHYHYADKAGPGRWVSADGLRQVRWDTTGHLFRGVPTRPHFNLETFRLPVNSGLKIGRPIENVHLWISLWGYFL